MSDNQINAVVPAGIISPTVAPLIVTTPLGSSEPLITGIDSYSPEIFSVNQTGGGQGAEVIKMAL